MMRKKKNADLRVYYIIFLETGLIITLLIFLGAVKINLRADRQKADLTTEQEVVEMEEVIQTKQIEKPPPPPRPPVPVEVPNDEILEDDIINLDAELDLDQPLEMPPPPDNPEEEEEDFFIVVEHMPQLKGGQQWLYNQVDYPEMARRAGIEGRVIVQFIVNEQGKVEQPRVIRGIGGGCDEEALRVIKKATFNPGRQRENPVRVQMSQPIVFQLRN